jgi:hypothetical protein
MSGDDMTVIVKFKGKYYVYTVMGDNWINAIFYGEIFDDYNDALNYAYRFTGGTEYGLVDLSDIYDSEVYTEILKGIEIDEMLNRNDYSEHIQRMNLTEDIKNYQSLDKEIKEYANKHNVNINTDSKLYKIFTTNGLASVTAYTNDNIKNMDNLMIAIEYDNFAFKNGLFGMIKYSKGPTDYKAVELMKTTIVDHYIKSGKSLDDIHKLILPIFLERKQIIDLHAQEMKQIQDDINVTKKLMSKFSDVNKQINVISGDTNNMIFSLDSNPDDLKINKEITKAAQSFQHMFMCKHTVAVTLNSIVRELNKLQNSGVFGNLDTCTDIKNNKIVCTKLENIFIVKPFKINIEKSDNDSKEINTTTVKTTQTSKPVYLLEGSKEITLDDIMTAFTKLKNSDTLNDIIIGS